LCQEAVGSYKKAKQIIKKGLKKAKKYFLK
jgi:hypothetical protein